MRAQSVEYLAPARFDDELEVFVRVARIGRTSVGWEFAAYNVSTTDGRFLTGLIAEQTPNTVTLVDAKNERTVLPRSKIEKMEAAPTSLMPEA